MIRYHLLLLNNVRLSLVDKHNDNVKERCARPPPHLCAVERPWILQLQTSSGFGETGFRRFGVPGWRDKNLKLPLFWLAYVPLRSVRGTKWRHETHDFSELAAQTVAQWYSSTDSGRRDWRVHVTCQEPELTSAPTPCSSTNWNIKEQLNKTKT